MVLLSALTTTRAQEVSTEVIPSEEELLDALSNGEIDYDTYLLLYDLLLNGGDSSQAYLFDQIPSAVGDQSDQARGFVSHSGKERLRARYQFGGELKDSGRTKYRVSGKYRIDKQWSSEFGAAKEYSGNERFMRRSLTYERKKRRGLTRLTAGSFRARFGLGSIVGYRGKLFDYSDKIDGESFLFPDYGGFNGVMAEGVWNNLTVSALGSVQRDDDYSMTTIAAQGVASAQAGNAALVGAVHLIKNRATSEVAEVYQVGTNLTRKSRTGSWGIDYSYQPGGIEGSALVFSAARKWSRMNMTVNGWSYGEEYLDLTAGSRAASLSATTEIESVSFRFSDKRSGQTGGRLQVECPVSSQYTVNGDLLFAKRGSDTSTLQVLTAVERRFNSGNTVKADFLFKKTSKRGDGASERRRGRFEWSQTRTTLRTKAAVSFTSESSYGEYWSLLLQVSGGRQTSERWQVWSSLRRFAHGRIDAWHGFVSISEELARGVRGAIKFTDSYSRSGSPKHAPSLTLEVQVQL